MKKQILLLLALSAGSEVFAQEPNLSLEKRVEELEKKQNSDELSFLNNLQFKGFLDLQYSYNFNQPRSGINGLRLYDNRAQTFRLNNVELDFEKPANNPGDMGFRLVTNFGQDADIFASSGTGNSDEFDVQQAYFHGILAEGNGIDLKIGKMSTLIGMEVIEARDNAQISRSLLFSFGTPTTHTGARASYQSETAGFAAEINNGWDNVNDNNQRPSFVASVWAHPATEYFFALTGMVGPEQTNIEGRARRLVDALVKLGPFGPVTLGFNADYGAERLGSSGAEYLAQWRGAAGYVSWDMDENWTLSGRAEYFSDVDGSRTGTVQSIDSWTATLQRKFSNAVLGRLEFRSDFSNSSGAFPDHALGTTTEGQKTLAVQLLVNF